MRLNSLAFRLLATLAAWTLVVLPIAGIIIFSIYTDDLQRNYDDRLKRLADGVRLDSMDGIDEPLAPVNRFEPLFEQTHSGWYWQVKPLDEPGKRKLVSASLATASLDSPLERKFPADVTGTRWMNVKGPVGEPVRIVELIDTLQHEPGPKYSITVAGPIEDLNERIGEFGRRLSIALALAGLGLLATTLFQVRFGLLPLRQIERGLAAIRSGEKARLDGQLPAEIEPLQSELNALIHSNQDIVDRARTQVGNLAHALKTPLAVITNEARDDKSAFAKKVAEQAQIMRDQVSHYLDRARMAARVGVIGRVTPILPLVEPLTRALERIHRDKGVRIKVDCPADARFQGEKHDLEEMLGNLLDNASKWSKRGVFLSVSVPVPAKGHPKQAVILVEDDGPGLSAEQRAKIGKRGMRLDESKPGSGLGLSIVTDLAQSYRGSVELDASRHGGLAVRLVLPAA